MGDGQDALGGRSGTFGSDRVVVLVVDDDPDVLETTSGLLEHADGDFDYECRTAASGAEALDVLAEAAVDCVVCDYEMPGMDGLEVLSAIRDRGSDVPFILFTGHGNEGVASEAITAGVTDYVRKDGRTQVTVLRKRIESAVGRYRAEAERDLRSRAIEAVGEGIAIIDDEGRFVDVNQAYADIYGYESEELLGSSWERINPPDENERMHLQILPAVESGGQWSGESIGLRADGTTFPKSKSFTKLDGGGFVCAVRDVTEQKQQEKELREQNERLREFARLVSHDLRNPLNVAEGYLSLVAEETDSEHLDRVASAHSRMRRLIEDMLSLAREGRVVDSPEPTSLSSVVDAAAASTSLRSEGSLVVEELPVVVADGERLEALFENLFGNALTHAGPEPTVRVRPLSDGFCVEDDGPGIPVSDRVTVFKSGYTSENDGTGFGLSIVKRIAEAHEWTVSVRDGIDGGARFEFRGVEFVDDANAAGGAGSEGESETKLEADGGDDENGDSETSG